MNPYLKTQVDTSTPVERVILLYDKAIVLLQEAIDAINAGDVVRKVNAIVKADRILRVLNASLDMERGGEVAENLRKFYNHILDMLVVANAENNVDLLEAAIEMLKTVKVAWEEIKEKEQ